MDADTPSEEHSNVARLYRAHPKDDEIGQSYRRYIPGIGTYFPEIGDPGGTTSGRGMGAWGQARLDWAFKEFASVLRRAEARATNPSNKIVSVRVAVFGFSRGAALARAFCRDLQASCTRTSDGFSLRHGVLARSGMTLRGGYPIEVYFLGLFDTVASVGLPMSANNMTEKRRTRSAWSDLLKGGSADGDLLKLAFGARGADPSPGLADGHGAWAGRLQISPMVRRCVHMLAAHEMRNSFPLDSALNGKSYPPNTVEMVYPGVHSDVGGGYRQGEGGKSSILAQVPLRTMLQEAIDAGVPVRHLSQLQSASQKRDFALDAEGIKAYEALLAVWRDYMRHHGSRVPLGSAVLAHMAEYWRYRLTVAAERTDPAHAGRSGWGGRPRVLTSEQQTIQQSERLFAVDRKRLEDEVRQARGEHSAILAQRQGAEEALEAARASPAFSNQAPMWQSMIRNLEMKEASARARTLRAQARLDTAANDSDLIDSLDEYDTWLLDDARRLCEWHKAHPDWRMRPHYKAIAEAYQEVVVEGRRMSSGSSAYRLFNGYVHDSLASFGQDNTRPSDPRVLYMGEDIKIDYAFEPAGTQEALTLPA